ncbi:MAG: protein kinase [Acidimicrobiales bacterium]|nr:protein kinase [Acidimicrobiales bacterium]
MPPPQIGGYTDLVQVAKGGFGVVYRARQERFDRVVAVKVLSVVDLTERDRERFDRECRAMGALSWHPHVVAVYDSGVADDGHPFLAMEYLSGGSMGDRLSIAPFPWKEAVSVGVQVAGALGAAHAAGTLHRDLKPENLLVGPFGEAKLGDFGIAAVDGSSGTTTGTASLTVAHVAPELLAGDRPDERSDIYGLASTLHTLIVGRPPFVEQHGEPVAAIITRVLRSPAPPAAGAPDDLAALLQQCLAKDPAARPQTAAAFGRRLQEVQAAHGLAVTELRLAPHSTPDDPAPTAEGAGDSSPTVMGIPTVPPPETPAPAAPAPSAPEPEPEPELAPPPPAPEPPPAAPEPEPLVEAPAAERTSGPEPAARSAPPAPRSGSRSRGVLVGALLVLVVLVAGAIVVGLSRSGSDSPSDDVAGPSTSTPTSTPPSTERDGGPVPFTEPAVVASVGVDPDPVGVAATGTDLWVTHSVDAGVVTRIDATTDQVIERIPVGRSPRGVAATADAVWVTNFDDDTVDRIDPTSGDVVDTLAAGPSPRGVSATDTAVWVTNFDDATVTRIDPSSGAIVATVDVGSEPLRVEATDEQVWVTNSAGDTVTRIDPATDQVVATVTVGARPHSVVFSDGAVWASSFESGTVSRIDPATNDVAATIDLGPGIGSMVVSDDALWVTNTTDGTLTRIGLADDAVQATIPTARGAAGMALADGAVWVANTGADDVSRVEPASG